MASGHTDRTLAFAGHVRACECDGNVILLDLRSSRYLGIGGPVSQVLAHHVDNWPTCTTPSWSGAGVSAADAPDDSSIGELIRRLCLQGLLVNAPPGQGSAPGSSGETGDAAFTAAARSMTCELEEATSTIRLDSKLPSSLGAARRMSHALRFTSSAACAAYWLRCRSLLSISQTVAARRARLLGPQAESLDAMEPSIAAYEQLRPFLFTARAKCLLDSLAMVGFLARAGFAARWVVGVRTGPFAAHSWVQHGGTVLNDQHEYVRQFRPIHAV